MKQAKTLILSLLLLVLLPCILHARPTMAFGYLANDSLDYNYEYLETIFPNSFANSLKNIFEIEVYKPSKINKRLEEYKITLQRRYKLHEIPDLLEKIDADFFIYGSFVPLSNNRIKIVLNLYQKGSNRIFSFTNIGRMESEIFKLVDRITMIIVNFMDDEQMYKSAPVPKGSAIAIMTNLEGSDLNAVYFPFLKKGFTVSYFQGNTLTNPMTDKKQGLFQQMFGSAEQHEQQHITRFQYITTETNTYNIITNPENMYLLGGTWADNKYMQKIKYQKKIFELHDTEYIKTKNIMLSKLSLQFNNTIDMLLIIGFNSSKKKAWVRCIDVKNKELIWMQSNIKGSNQSEIAGKIIKLMTRSTQMPFQINN